MLMMHFGWIFFSKAYIVKVDFELEKMVASSSCQSLYEVLKYLMIHVQMLNKHMGML